MVNHMSFNPIMSKLQVLGATAAGSVTLPANAVIRDILVNNTNANAVTGGLKFGSSAGATDIAAALAVGANALSFVTDALLLKRWFSTSATQSVFYDAVVAWNSANVNITIIYNQL